MLFNAKASEHVGVVAVCKPDATGAGNVDSGWVAVKDWLKFMAVLSIGDLGSSATILLKLQQASDSSGTGAEDITGKVTATYTQAGTDYSNKQAIINLAPEECVGAALSFKSGTATHIRMRMTVATATSDATAILLGFGPRVQASDAIDSANVVAVG